MYKMNFAGGMVLRRLSALHSNHKRIAAGALLIGILTIIAKLFAATREMAIAWRYGVSGTVDAYQLALTITTWLPMMLTSVMTVVLVPRLVALEQGSMERRSFMAELNGTVLVMGIALATLTYLLAPAISLLLASRIDPRTTDLTSTMSRAMSLVALWSIAVGYFSARLQSRERFGYSVTEAIPALIIALFVIGIFPIRGGAALVAGTVFGFLAQGIVLSIMVQRGDGGLGPISLRHRSSEWRSLYASAAIMTAAQAVLALSIPIDQAFAARLGPGAVATLGYANRIVILITGFGAVVLARALLPVLSRTVVEGKHHLGKRQARQWGILLGVAGMAIALIFWLLARWGVSLVFQRGAFTETNTAAVARALQFGTIQLPFYFGGLALVQWMAATSRFPYMLFITICALAAKIAANTMLTPILGLNGIMISTALMYLVTLILLVVGMGRSFARAPMRHDGAERT